MDSRRSSRDSNGMFALGFGIALLWGHGGGGRSHASVAHTKVELRTRREIRHGAKSAAVAVLRNRIAACKGGEWTQSVQSSRRGGDAAAAAIDCLPARRR